MAKKEKKKLNKVSRWFRTLRRAEPFLYRPFFPYKKYGHTEMFKDRAYIFVGNHLSVLDVVFPAVSTNRAVHFMAKKSLFEKGLMKKFVNKCECIPVNRDGTDVKAVMLAMKYLKMGENVVIFPEGTRTKTGRMGDFKRGAFMLAGEFRLPVVPLSIQGAYDIMPKDSYFPRAGKITLTIHKPIYPGEKGFNSKLLLAQCHDTIAETLGEKEIHSTEAK